MTSSENLGSFATYEPWLFQSTPAYADSWLTEAFARETETLTRALQKTLSSDTNNNNSDTVITSSDAISPFHKPQQHTPSGSGVSGSDPEMVASAPRRRAAASAHVTATKKITKRKPRASKKCQTTFIMADPVNFRQMVQKVTGVRLETLRQQQQLIVKPEAKRLTGMGFSLATEEGECSFLLERSEQVGGGEASGQVAFGDLLLADGSSGSGHGYERYQSFPTLESWQVMCDY